MMNSKLMFNNSNFLTSEMNKIIFIKSISLSHLKLKEKVKIKINRIKRLILKERKF